MNYKEVHTRQCAALDYVRSKIKEFGNDSEVAGYKKIFEEIEIYLMMIPGQIVLRDEVALNIRVMDEMLDVLESNLDFTIQEEVNVRDQSVYQSDVLNKMISELKLYGEATGSK